MSSTDMSLSLRRSGCLQSHRQKVFRATLRDAAARVRFQPAFSRADSSCSSVTSPATGRGRRRLGSGAAG